MRINSDFYDTYDMYRSYDKTDPIVYNRHKTVMLGQMYVYKNGKGKHIPNPDMPDDLKIFPVNSELIRDDNFIITKMNIVSFCGMPIIYTKREINWRSSNREEQSGFPTVDQFQEAYGRFPNFPIAAMNFIRNGNYERLLKAHKKYQSPIINFCLLSGHVVINPKLGEKFTVKSPGEIYQEIESFIANELTEQMKCAKMTDKEKVVSHGFDLKSSFRN
jgi:hypothetical protein